MFVDLNASTTIAEVLDSQKYSEFIRDFVADLSDPIYRHEGQILQYVGDEIIVYWPLRKKKHLNARPVRCFVSMMNIIERKKAYYQKKYGFLPEFKAGLHGGELIVAELGVLKKEIAFLGDVVNTTARIQNKCADLNTNFLISEYIIEKAELSPEFVAFSEGVFQLKGKNEKIELFSVEKAANAWKREEA
jgi:adenylate cyclase